MTEFAVGAAVLTLLLLGTVTLATYQEVDRRGIMAARQAVWMRGWAPGQAADGAVEHELYGEYFQDRGVLEPTGRRLLVVEGDLSMQSGLNMPTGIAGDATQILLRPLRVASGFLGSGFDLEERGLAQGRLTTHIQPVAELPEPFSSIDLGLQARAAILMDAWHSSGPSQVESRAGGLVPSSVLEGLSAIWRPLSLPLRILEPSLGQLCFGLIEPDRIPEDRLGAGRTALPGECP